MKLSEEERRIIHDALIAERARRSRVAGMDQRRYGIILDLLDRLRCEF